MCVCLVLLTVICGKKGRNEKKKKRRCVSAALSLASSVLFCSCGSGGDTPTTLWGFIIRYLTDARQIVTVTT